MLDRDVRGALPPALAQTVLDLRSDTQAYINDVTERARDFGNDYRRALLAGIGMTPEARRAFDYTLSNYWLREAPREAGTVIVGAGLHAAIAASAITAAGGDFPLVVGASPIGGAFAWSKQSVFRLNSRNRPGPIGAAGTRAALNVIPNGPVQPSDLGMDEYQTNTEMSFAIRCALALNARVVLDSALRVRDGEVELVNNGTKIRCEKVILATGLGTPKSIPTNSTTVLRDVRRYFGSVSRKRFPLRDLKRVAVIGGGDSAMCVIEHLLGIGPPPGLSSATLDFVERIDWYGAPARYGDEFINCVRSRYAGIGRHMPRRDEQYDYRVAAMPRADAVDGRRVLYGNRRSAGYDLIVNATGFKPDRQLIDGGWEEVRMESPYGGDWTVALRHQDADVYRVGPCANLGIELSEYRNSPALDNNIPQNSVAAFRYAPRTAELASSLV